MENQCQSTEPVDVVAPDGGQSIENDGGVVVPDGSNNNSESSLTKNGLVLRPVVGNEAGKGYPYAPADWPEPGDMWGWKVGNRKNVSGFWQDRYLYLPTRLEKPNEKRRFASMLAVKRYVQEKYPNADVDAFFASFSWRIPATGAEGETTISGTNRTEKMSECSQSELKVETVDCRAGNWMCRLQLQARKYSMPSMDCDICCTETGFCRDCCCILCCNAVDWAYGAYSFIRCEEKVDDRYICGHVAHIDCALRSQMAGTVLNSGLDVEYYCRRCDKRSDLTVHVTRLLRTCESLESRDDIEKILNVGLHILSGSQQQRSKRLMHRIELSLAKLKNGNCLEDVWKLEENKLTLFAGEISRSGSNGSVTTNKKQKPFITPSKKKQNQDPSTSNHRIEDSEFDEKIERALRQLRDSQNHEYTVAEEGLCAQKDYILGLYNQLEAERSELAKGTDCGYTDALRTNIKHKMNQIKQEVLKLKEMEEVAKGFGRVPKGVLQEHFNLQID
ncbi:hypothetical protein ACHQM5_027505 [Ranunculus cassubicifolius]